MKSPITAERLTKALELKNIIPVELSQQSGVSQASISQYMNGSHAPSNISSAKMAMVLDVNPMWLMGFDVPMKKEFPDKTENPKYNDNVTHLFSKIRSDENMVNIINKYYETDDVSAKRMAMYALLLSSREDKALQEFLLKYLTLEGKKKELFDDMITSMTQMMN